jgi:hypothetical protein
MRGVQQVHTGAIDFHLYRLVQNIKSQFCVANMGRLKYVQNSSMKWSKLDEMQDRNAAKLIQTLGRV